MEQGEGAKRVWIRAGNVAALHVTELSKCSFSLLDTCQISSGKEKTELLVLYSTWVVSTNADLPLAPNSLSSVRSHPQQIPLASLSTC
jgi:hypothetical protein